MSINLQPWLAAMSELKFGQLANVQTVGIGLYLALAVIQAVSATGVAGLRRRATTLRTAVLASKLAREFANMHRLQADVSRLEIGFHDFNRRFLAGIALLFAIAVSYFAYCTIWQDWTAELEGTLFILVFYLVLPIAIFTGSGILIAARCRDVGNRVREAERRVQAELLNL